MAAFHIHRRRHGPVMNHRLRQGVIRDFDPDQAAIVQDIQDHETERFLWSRKFPTGKPSLRLIGRIDRLIIGRLARLGVESDSLYPFMTPLIEAVSNAMQHGRTESRLELELDIRCSVEWLQVIASVTNPVPATRRLALPSPRLKRYGRRGKGAWIMACEVVDRYAVIVQNGEFYRVVLTKLLPRGSG